jgi:pyridoxal phosphate enzyme (YggS family)
MSQDRIAGNLAAVRSRIAEAARRSGRDASDITLVAVTKRNSSGPIRELVKLGQVDLGENYPQELWAKAEELADLPVRWHLIGHLQGNKARKTVPMVRMIHGVDSLKLLRTLDELAEGLANPPKVCLQVNVSGEESKHGWGLDTLLTDAEAIAACRRIPIVGLMTIAGYGTSSDEARPAFARLRELRDRLRLATDLALPELSMGMSGDFEAAVEEGATLVRVGSALFEGVVE